MRGLQEKKGITLIALIVTVILLLILAGVSVSMIDGSGLFGTAKDSSKKYTQSQLEEKLQLAKAEYLMDNVNENSFAGYLSYIESNSDEYGISEVEIENNEATVTMDDGSKFLIQEDGEMKITYIGNGGTIKLSSYSGVYALNEEKTIQITVNSSGGELSVENSNPSAVEVELAKNGTLGSITIRAIKANDTATITVKSGATGDYGEGQRTYTVNILNQIESTAEAYQGAYDGTAHGISVTSTTPGAEITYSTDGSTYTSELPTYTQTGGYTTYYKIEKEGYATVSGSLTVTISRANGGITLSSSSGNFNGVESKTITVSNNTGTVSAESANTNAAEVSVNGNEVTITSKSISTQTTVNITITSQQSTNYEEATATYVATVKPYKVTYESNGGSGNMSDSIGPNVTISNNSFTAPSGKRFVNWNTATNGSGTSYNVNTQITLTSNLILYAQWENKPIESVSLNQTAKTMNIGESYTLTATVLPSDALNKNVVWSSSDTSIATVTNGTVSTLKDGEVTITATSEVDNTKYASCTVTINITNGIVDYWPLKNSLANQISGGAGDLTICKGSTPTYNSYGAYLNNIVLQTQNNYTMPTNYSIVFQIKATQINTWSHVIGKKISFVNQCSVTGLWIHNTSSTFVFQRSDNTGQRPGAVYSVGTQSTVVITHSGTTMKVYVDGTLIGTNTTTGAAESYNAKFFVGGSSLSGQNAGSGVTEGYSPGYYKNIMVLNRALSATEVSNLQTYFNQ